MFKFETDWKFVEIEYEQKYKYKYDKEKHMYTVECTHSRKICHMFEALEIKIKGKKKK